LPVRLALLSPPSLERRPYFASSEGAETWAQRSLSPPQAQCITKTRPRHPSLLPERENRGLVFCEKNPKSVENPGFLSFGNHAARRTPARASAPPMWPDVWGRRVRVLTLKNLLQRPQRRVGREAGV